MPRGLSPNLILSANAIESKAPWVFLYELAIDGRPGAPLRYTDDNATVVYQGNAFLPTAIQLEALSEQADGLITRLTLSVGDANGQVMTEANAHWHGIEDPLWLLTIWHVDATQPDETPVAHGEAYDVLSITTDFVVATLQLQTAGITGKAFAPRRRYTTANGFPHIPRL